MNNKRKNPSNNKKTRLYAEVNGYCPLCNDKLMYEKNNSFQYKCEVAHIYPLNPKEDEIILLSNVEKLSNDVDDIKNLICLCRDCHKKFDNPRTLEEYNNLLKIKKKLIEKKEIKDEFYSYKIEEEIKDILHILANDEDNESTIRLEYDPKKIDNKTNHTIENLTKRKIKNHISEFFHIIKNEFRNIDSIKPNKATKIATQIKSFYFEVSEKNSSQEFIYNYLVEWLDKKTNINKDASSIVISYFVQDCEVFDVIPK